MINLEHKRFDNVLQYLFFNDDNIVVYLDNNMSEHIVIKNSTFNEDNPLTANMFFLDVTNKHIAKSYDEWLNENNLEDKRNENHKMWLRRNNLVRK